MNVAELLAELSSRGVMLEVAGDRLRVKAPKGAITADLHEALTNSKHELIALINVGDAEIAWRVRAMLQQIPESGPLPLLMARESIEPKAGCCLSCGNPLNPGDTYRCAACGRAANLAIEMSLFLKKKGSE